jgi:hypothetical protein
LTKYWELKECHFGILKWNNSRISFMKFISFLSKKNLSKNWFVQSPFSFQTLQLAIYLTLYIIFSLSYSISQHLLKMYRISPFLLLYIMSFYCFFDFLFWSLKQAFWNSFVSCSPVNWLLPHFFVFFHSLYIFFVYLQILYYIQWIKFVNRIASYFVLIKSFNGILTPKIDYLW